MRRWTYCGIREGWWDGYERCVWSGDAGDVSGWNCEKEAWRVVYFGVERGDGHGSRTYRECFAYLALHLDLLFIL